MKNNKKYQEYLQSSHWQYIRTECISYYGNVCYCCNVPMKMSLLEVHHMHYKTLGSEDYKQDVIPLCKRCHEKIHLEKSYDRNTIEILKDKTEKYYDYLNSQNNKVDEEDIDLLEQYNNNVDFINSPVQKNNNFTSIADILKSKYKL